MAKTITVEELITKLTILERIAKVALKTTSSTTINKAVCQYGRSMRKEYTSSEWNTVAGVTPTKFLSALKVDKQYEECLLDGIGQVVLPDQTTIDLPHLFGTLSCCYAGSAALGGWGGDLVTYASDIKNKKIKKLKTGLYEFPAGTFDIEDYRTDLDAQVIYTSKTLKKVNGTSIAYLLSDKIRCYYLQQERHLRREKWFLSTSSKKDLWERFKAAVKSDLFLRYLKNNTYGVTDSQCKTAAKAMQAYVERS